MFNFFRKFFTVNIGLKITALALAFMLWFYVVGELNKGSEEERRILNSVLPQGEAMAKKLIIKPIFIGKPRQGYLVDPGKTLIAPEYCIVVGNKKLLDKIRFIYTLPIDVNGVNRSFSRSVPLNPIAPGIYMEETLVQVTVPVEKTNP